MEDYYSTCHSMPFDPPTSHMQNPSISQNLDYYSNSRSKLPSLCHQLKISKSHHINQVFTNTLSLMHPEVKLLFICRHVFFFYFCSQNTVVRHRIPVIDIPVQMGRKVEGKRSHWSQAISNSSQANSIKFQGLGIIFWGL